MINDFNAGFKQKKHFMINMNSTNQQFQIRYCETTLFGRNPSKTYEKNNNSYTNRSR